MVKIPTTFLDTDRDADLRPNNNSSTTFGVISEIRTTAHPGMVEIRF